MARISQRVLLMALLLSAMNASIPATIAAAQDKQGPSQQDKMKACNNMADKKGLTGNDRKNFMQDCVSKATSNQPLNDVSQKDKMNVCKNLADKKSLQGSDRRSFIKDCMNKANPK
jgi:hypothetical protein